MSVEGRIRNAYSYTLLSCKICTHCARQKGSVSSCKCSTLDIYLHACATHALSTSYLEALETAGSLRATAVCIATRSRNMELLDTHKTLITEGRAVVPKHNSLTHILTTAPRT